MATERDDRRDFLLEAVDEQLRQLGAGDPWSNVVGTLGAVAGTLSAVVIDSRPAGFNPNPPGNIHHGGATQQVLELMRRFPHRWWRKQGLQWALPRATIKGLDWALLALKRRGLIETRLASGHSRYLQYRIAPPANQQVDAEPFADSKREGADERLGG